MKTTSLLNRSLVVLTSLTLLLAFGPRARCAAPAEAKQILAATGVKGGFIVHLGCGDGQLTAALRASDSYLVHGLDADAANIEKARQHLQSLHMYGPVAVEQWKGPLLPYNDNLVNLVVAESLGGISMGEVMRVLAPNGVAYVKSGGQWQKTVKPRPSNIDEWTHYLHDPSNNAVAHDTAIGPIKHYQWIGSPRYSRHHDNMSSISAMVSANGRNFYIFDEGATSSIMLPSKWSLVGRDAFNGTILWRQPISTWHPQLYPFKSGPAELPRRLVAVGDRVYATLALDAPLTVLDAATGEKLRTYDGTKSTEEILLSEGILFLLVNPTPPDWSKFKPESNNIGTEKTRVAEGYAWDKKPRRILAIQADTGAVVWQKEAVVVPLTLAADGRAVFFHDGQKIVCLDRKNGQEIWRSEPVSMLPSIPTCFAPTLVLTKDVVLFAGGDRLMCGLSIQTGKKLWSAPHQPGGHNSPEDLLVVGGLVWSGAVANTKDSGVFTGRDLLTGAVKNEFPPDTSVYFMHHRCYRAKATDNFLLPSRTGVEFVDYRTKHWTPEHWVRSGCLYGIMPCNGYVYTTPQDCACYEEAKLTSFCALSPEWAPRAGAPASEADRLEQGPAYAESITATPASPEDWPTYRHDGARSGYTEAPLSGGLTSDWQIKLGGKLSSPVVADGRLIVAAVDAHTVHALDARSGKPLWTFTAGARVDSAPTIFEGRVLFGSADGWIYCVRAQDGKLAWRFRAAPEERRLVSFEQVESVWPVSGSVLVEKGIVYGVAGRSMFLDGGMRLVKLDAKTGKKISENILDDRDPETKANLQTDVKNLNMPVALPDILSCDGRYVYMRSQRFDLEGQRQDLGPRAITVQQGEGAHLFCPTGFLDNDWWHRSYWIYGRTFAQGAGGWPQAAKVAPAGRPMVVTKDMIYGFGRVPEYYKWTTPVEYQLFAATKTPKMPEPAPAKKAASPQAKIRAAAGGAVPRQVDYYRWSDPASLQVRAMVLAGQTLVFAGPPQLVNEAEAFTRPNDPDIKAKLQDQNDAMQGKKGSVLLAISAADGKKISEEHFDSVPVFDSMIAANRRLYLTTEDGTIRCFGQIQ